MLFLLHVAAQTPPADEPTLRPGLDPASVTPGTAGFIATLFVVVVVIFLIRDMVKRVRRVRYAAEVEENRARRDAASGSMPRNDAATGTADGRPEDPTATIHPTRGGKHGPDNR